MFGGRLRWQRWAHTPTEEARVIRVVQRYQRLSPLFPSNYHGWIPQNIRSSFFSVCGVTPMATEKLIELVAEVCAYFVSQYKRTKSKEMLFGMVAVALVALVVRSCIYAYILGGYHCDFSSDPPSFVACIIPRFALEIVTSVSICIALAKLNSVETGIANASRNTILTFFGFQYLLCFGYDNRDIKSILFLTVSLVVFMLFLMLCLVNSVTAYVDTAPIRGRRARKVR